MNRFAVLVCVVSLFSCTNSSERKTSSGSSNGSSGNTGSVTGTGGTTDGTAGTDASGADDVTVVKDEGQGGQDIKVPSKPDVPTVPDTAPAQDTNDTAEAADTQTGSDTSAQVDTADIGASEDTAAPKEKVVRFIGLGDTGEGNEDQYKVGVAATKICKERGCDFALLLGDNFYDGGVTSVDDPQFVTKFEQPYETLDMPFYVVMGNHDYGELSFEWYRGEFQKQYAQQNPKWVFPKEYYSFTAEEGYADFFAFDTARLMWGDMVDEQKAFLNKAIGDSKALWKVAFAHHPYLSNGKHGNAGSYEGIPGIPVLSGGTVKEFMDEVVCGKVDLYLCGHDHNRQSFQASASDCGVHLIVSGASSKTSDFENHNNNDTLWDDDKKEGFIWIELKGDVMTGAWYDKDANLDIEYTINK